MNKLIDEMVDGAEKAAVDAFPELPEHMKQAPEGWVRMICREEIIAARQAYDARFEIQVATMRLALETNLRDARHLQTIVENCRKIALAHTRHETDTIDALEAIKAELRK